MTASVLLVRGDDAAIVGQELRKVLGKLVDGRDPAMVVEEFDEQSSDFSDVGVILDAISTPPFLTDRRVVVVRDAGRISASEASRLAAAISNPVPGVFVVFASAGGSFASSLQNAIEREGSVVDTKVGTGRARTQWLSARMRDAPVKLDARAQAHLSEHLGEDLGRLEGLLSALASAYGESAHVTAEQLEPFLGSAGGVPSWDLTDALDKGDSPGALRALERLLVASASPALVVLATLHRHYERLLRLDGAGATSPSEAAGLLGVRSDFLGKKALEQSARLGSERIGRAITLLAQADLDIRGASGLSDAAVLQVLVARLSRLSPGQRRPVAGRRARP